MPRLLQRTPPIAAGLAVGGILGLPFLWFLAVRLLALAGSPMRDRTGADVVAALWPPATLVATAVWGLWLGLRCGRPAPWAGALAAVLGLGVALHGVALGWAHDPIVDLLRAASPRPSASTVVGLEVAATAAICAATTGLLLGMAARDLKATLALGAWECQC